VFNVFFEIVKSETSRKCKNMCHSATKSKFMVLFHQASFASDTGLQNYDVFCNVRHGSHEKRKIKIQSATVDPSNSICL
jgi:hypothetical protein